MRQMTTWTTALLIGSAVALVSPATEPAGEPPAAAAAEPQPAPQRSASGGGGVTATGDTFTFETVPATQSSAFAARVDRAVADYFLVARPAQAPVKAAFLGVDTSPAQPALQKQLRLKPGVGLVVDGVEPGSPAGAAGVKEFDVLHKLDEQLLINAEQFAVLVRTYAPGAEVRLTVIREGKPVVLTAKLVEREVPPLALSLIDVAANEQANFVDQAVKLTPGVAYTRQANPTLFANADVVAADDGMVCVTSPDGRQTISAAQVTIEDDAHRVTVSSRDGRKYMKVTQKADGWTLFDGPADDQSQLEEIPKGLLDACREILMNKGTPTRSPVKK